MHDGWMTTGEPAGPLGPGDLGRRVAQRRQERGLSREELAAAAELAPGYLEYVEEHPADVTTAVLMRLARALDTNVADLLGKGLEHPPGHGAGSARPALEALSDQECRRLIAPGGVGRLIFVEARGPVAIPVNFGVLDGDVVFRSATGSPATSVDGREVGFEVDRIDDVTREGWSVVVTGRARRLLDPDELARARALGIHPWAGGDRDVYIRLPSTEMSGRRIRVER